MNLQEELLHFLGIHAGGSVAEAVAELENVEVFMLRF